ncbi:hypothetical protein [Streptomyces griseoruber]
MAGNGSDGGEQSREQDENQGQGCFGCGTITGRCADPNRHGLT